MSTGRISLRREQETMLMTLHLHAKDAASAHPILDDRFAADLLDRVEHTPGRLSSIDGNMPVVCARARLIDDATRGFLDRYPDAVVLHLGCGLDSRVERVEPGPGVAWFDVDQAPVIELRERLYPERDGVTVVAASVTDPGWWEPVPTGRPRLVVAEGMFMYLDPAGVRAAVTGALDRSAPACTLVADSVAPWVLRVAGWQPAMRAAGTGFRSTTDDLDAAVRPSLALDRAISLPEEAARRTSGAMSGLLRAVNAVPGVSRGMVLRTYAADLDPQA